MRREEEQPNKTIASENTQAVLQTIPETSEDLRLNEEEEAAVNEVQETVINEQDSVLPNNRNTEAMVGLVQYGMRAREDRHDEEESTSCELLTMAREDEMGENLSKEIKDVAESLLEIGKMKEWSGGLPKKHQFIFVVMQQTAQIQNVYSPCVGIVMCHRTLVRGVLEGKGVEE